MSDHACATQRDDQPDPREAAIEALQTMPELNDMQIVAIIGTLQGWGLTIGWADDA